MSHISLMSGPIASRTTRTRRTSSAGDGLPGSAICVFISTKPLSTSRRAAVAACVVGQPAAQRAGGIGRHPVARAAEQLPQRLLQRLALDVPQRDVDRRQRQREDAAGPAGIAGGGAQLAQRSPRSAAGPRRSISAPSSSTARAQRAGQRAAVEGEADALDAAVGLRCAG